MATFQPQFSWHVTCKNNTGEQFILLCARRGFTDGPKLLPKQLPARLSGQITCGGLNHEDKHEFTKESQ